jgi:hypothetical protein
MGKVCAGAGQRQFKKLTILSNSMVSQCFVNRLFHSVGIIYFGGKEAFEFNWFAACSGARLIDSL